MDELTLKIRIPVFGYQAGAEVRRAYAMALEREVRAAAEELSEYTVSGLQISHANELGSEELERLLLVLRKSLNLASSWKEAEIAPERISTANMTVLRNFRTDWYRIDFGALNIVDFKALKRAYGYQVYQPVKQLLQYYGMHQFSAELLCGIPGQKTVSLQDSLNRALEMDPDGVCLRVWDKGAEHETEAAKELMAFGGEFLTEAGYRQERDGDYVKREVHYPAQAASCWGIGCGAVTCMDHVRLQNTPDLDAYLRDSGDLEKLIVSAEPMD